MPVTSRPGPRPALGNPLQEEWIATHALTIGAPLTIGVGALFDFLAGAVPRAPVRCGGCGSNGCIAGRRSPGACARRYTIGMARFLTLVLRQARGARMH
ncbi:MAG TPA: WecB/TagA/CpsF family glycosyltransferase [Beijerinckiaceae bacterium]|nr:WecB/TagA/CpsF family glycosyltransferase [Beijerinckiaceae bacterium]